MVDAFARMSNITYFLLGCSSIFRQHGPKDPRVHPGHTSQAPANQRELAALCPSILHPNVRPKPCIHRRQLYEVLIFSCRTFIIEHENEELGCIAIKWCAELFRVFGRPVPIPSNLSHRSLILFHDAGVARQRQCAGGFFVRGVRAATNGFSAPHLHALPKHGQFLLRSK